MVLRLGVGPSRLCLGPPASPPTGGARRLVGPPAADPLVDRPTPPLGGPVGAGYYYRALGDDGFVVVSMATVLPRGGSSLQPYLLLSPQ